MHKNPLTKGFLNIFWNLSADVVWLTKEQKSAKFR